MSWGSSWKPLLLRWAILAVVLVVAVWFMSGCSSNAPQRICTKEYKPVCGTNGKTYSNACEAEVAGTKVQHTGVCKTDLESGGHTHPPDDGAVGKQPPDDPSCAGVIYSTHTVTITKYGMSPPDLGLRHKAYEPRELSIERCDKVRWVNQDFRSSAMYHTATSTASIFQFDTGGLTKGTTSYWVQFPVIGKIPYFCKPHEWMKGRMNVAPKKGGAK